VGRVRRLTFQSVRADRRKVNCRLRQPHSLLAGGVLFLGVVVYAGAVPGVFTTDDNNYLINVLALRDGGFTVRNTTGLTPSRELLFFDPGPWNRAVTSTPVGSSAPPLYAPIALPFSWLGWRGLVALNTLAYLATAVLVFLYAERHATERSTPWMAALAFALGGFAIEYAQGVWPHALSLALCTAGLLAASMRIDGGRIACAAAAGFLLAVATGVRYQNAVILAAAGMGVALWSVPRIRSAAAFVIASAVPLAASAYINHIRLGSWNPVSKGEGYLRVPLVTDATSSATDPLVMLWARVVDFSWRPPLDFPWVTYDPVTGAHLMIGTTVQKALLQSAPWTALALAIFGAAWISAFQAPDARRRQLRFLSLIAAAGVSVFALAGIRRNEGLSFNQRYLLELLPVVAVGFAWALDGLRLRMRVVMAGALWGVMLGVLVLFATPVGGGPEDYLWLARQLAILKLPLAFSAATVVLWIVARRREAAHPALATAVGLCLGWALTLHVADDVAASRRVRARKLAETQALARVLTDGSALVAYTGYKDAAVPLLFDRDLVIVDARADQGEDAPILIRELLDRRRRVFVLRSGFPGDVLSRVVSGWRLVPVAQPGTDLVELRRRH
jgi:hypothetical protein